MPSVTTSPFRVERDLIAALLRAPQLMNDHVLLYGPPGVGKTGEAHSAVSPGQEMASYTGGPEESRAVMEGMYLITGEQGQFSYQDGHGPFCWKTGGLLVINEIDECSPDTVSFLIPLLDGSRVAKIRLITGEVITPQPGFRCIATMNGMPDDLRPALRDRFNLRILVDRPSSAMLDVLEEDIRRVCVAEYAAIAGKNREPKYSYRQLATLNRLRKEGMNPQMACALVCETEESAIALYEAVNVQSNQVRSERQAMGIVEASTPTGSVSDVDQVMQEMAGLTMTAEESAIAPDQVTNLAQQTPAGQRTIRRSAKF